MTRQEQRISPAGFQRLREALLTAELQGYGPDACAAHALHSIGLDAVPGRDVSFVVDYTLDGPVYPFMDWPDGWRPFR